MKYLCRIRCNLLSETASKWIEMDSDSQEEAGEFLFDRIGVEVVPMADGILYTPGESKVVVE